MCTILHRYSDHYRWKKVTSCIYNLLGSQRWVDHYGEMVITNEDQCSCKLTFVKVLIPFSNPHQSLEHYHCRLATGAPRSMKFMVMCTLLVERKYAIFTEPGMTPCSVEKNMMSLTVFGELVSALEYSIRPYTCGIL